MLRGHPYCIIPGKMTALPCGGFVLFRLENELEYCVGDPAKGTDPKAGAVCGGVLKDKWLREGSLSSEQLCGVCSSSKITIWMRNQPDSQQMTQNPKLLPQKPHANTTIVLSAQLGEKLLV